MRRSIGVPLALIVATSLLVACSDSGTDRQEVADQVGEELAANVETPLQDFIEAGRGPAAEDARAAVMAEIQETIEEFDPPPGVAKLTPAGHGAIRTVDLGVGFASLAAVVMPDHESEEPYCILAAVHSDGRVQARPSSADPSDLCEDAELIDFETAP
ncbi:MAG: hypothetical protein ACLFRT_10970 [Actinomycetota bacterium]